MSAEDPFWLRALGWAWGNWDLIQARLNRVYKWFRRDTSESASGPGILLIGPGGTGKTTLARLLSGAYTTRLFEDPWKYEESISEERYNLVDDEGVEVVVPPGQQHRRGAAWADVRADLTAGKYRGVILMAAYGHHTFGMTSYKHHPLYQGNKDQFLTDFLQHKRDDELRVLQFLRPALESVPGRTWLFVVVAKQDLWWPDRQAVKDHYMAGQWQSELAAVQAKLGVKTFRHEVEFVSLVISNFVTGEDEELKRNVAGYDQRLQVVSLRRLLEVMDGLREWEEGT